MLVTAPRKAHIVQVLEICLPWEHVLVQPGVQGVSICLQKWTEAQPGADLRAVMLPRPTAPIVARQSRGQETPVRGQGTHRDGRNILRGFREAALQCKACEMGRKTEPVVIDAIREEVEFGVGACPMGGEFVGAPVALHVCSSLVEVIEGS